MFSGIIENTGKVIKCLSDSDTQKIFIEINKNNSKVSIGDSIAINGACLTVEEINSNVYAFTISPETLKKTLLREIEEELDIYKIRKLTRLPGFKNSETAQFTLSFLENVLVKSAESFDKGICLCHLNRNNSIAWVPCDLYFSEKEFMKFDLKLFGSNELTEFYENGHKKCLEVSRDICVIKEENISQLAGIANWIPDINNTLVKGQLERHCDNLNPVCIRIPGLTTQVFPRIKGRDSC